MLDMQQSFELKKFKNRLDAKVDAMNARIDDLMSKYLDVLERLEALEVKRGPGRPKKSTLTLNA